MATVNIPSIADLDLEIPRHPHTGEILTPVWTTKAGRHLWPILGASEDDDSGDDGDDDSTDDDGDDDLDTDDDGDDDEGDDKDKKSKSKSKKDDDDDENVPKWKYDKVERRMKAADRRATTAESKIKELETQLAGKVDPKDVDKTTADENAKLKPQVAKLESANQALVLQVAFLTTNDTKWRDPEAALKLADLSEVDIDEDGKVDKRALRAALRQLAKDKPYLVDTGKKDADDDGDDDDEDKSSGPKMNSKRRGDKKTPTRATLAKRFPALNN